MWILHPGRKFKYKNTVFMELFFSFKKEQSIKRDYSSVLQLFMLILVMIYLKCTILDVSYECNPSTSSIRTLDVTET